ncbi:capsular biosynthesis protein [Clostridium perfringens]|uniref:capsular biosynthesis protein n=1 Tax=Clostridium perfringens TaxID=1502 RepID=UPI000B37FD5C|nr:capsular biosynthesis protein [Clostridium perfringens]EGS9999316.1 capsular biosynthesis protein [Clostridium perfringens]MCH1961954.1 capsular biosynthesis protein [Clostridium perfringens]MDK0566337.1 capsular biosynthesis protein [Clostridium perfringens]MDK0794525.1 capsular biosynthesis protein [Clostridium perfringens]OUN51644.1 capsular biosynthesis protein [Clostridium perfringens]
MNLKRNILRIFSANFLTMISGILLGFVVPAVLSVDSYAYFKTYTFYISYIGLLHLGFVDGMYIKYGGKELIDLDKSEFKLEHRVFIIFQIIITLLCLVIALVKKDIILILFSLSIIPINTFAFFSLFYQSIGEFKKYTNITYVYTIIYLLLNVILAVVFRNDNYILYCITSIIANGIVFLYLEFKYFKQFKGIKAKYDSKVWNNIKVGFFILLGNLSVLMFYAIDRWFIKFFYTVSDFAYYSFAISMLNIINLLISSISIAFFNYLSKGENVEKIKKLKDYFLILGVFASFGYFVFAGIVNIILRKYIPALDIIAVSFASYPYMIVINALYVNLYKARKKEKMYFKVVIFMVIISAFYNTIAMIINKNPVSIAVATTLSFITWYLYSVKDFRYLKSTKKEILYLGINTVSFLALSNFFNWLIGGVVYFLIAIVTTIILFKKEILEIYRIIVKSRFKE